MYYCKRQVLRLGCFNFLALLEIDADSHPVIRSVDYQKQTLETLKKGNFLYTYLSVYIE